MKKTICLYRVSTMGQVDRQEQDIPAQREKCREFAKSQGWTIIEEYTELGVSGFKVSAKDRDAIQDIRRRAEKREFDVLLVFMFDRIGRRRDETPFVVEWLIENDVEVWSTQEGQQKLDNDGDYLMNYIRYWTASSESKKTAMRTKNGLEHLVRAGHFRGGTHPYGYDLVRGSRQNKRGQDTYDLVVNEYEAAVVRDIFNMYANQGMGTFQIAMQLTAQGVKSRSGGWVAKTVLYMLKNMIYIGILKSGETYSEPFEQIRIVDDEIFNRAQVLIEERSRKNSLDRTTPMTSMGPTLLSGNIFCGHCGGRLTASTSGKTRHRKDGSVLKTKRTCYVCYNKSRKRKECDGASTYTAHWIDDAVVDAIRDLFKRLTDSPKNAIIDTIFENKLDDLRKQLALSNERLKAEADELQIYEAEVIKCLTGKSKFSHELLSKFIDEKTEIVNNLKAEIKSLERQLASGRESVQKVETQLGYLTTWADLFDVSDDDTKKMIIANLIKRVIVSRDYRITIEYNSDVELLKQAA